MRCRELSIAGFLLFAVASAKPEDQPSYDVGRISPGLRVDAPVVIRKDMTTFRVRNKRKAEETHTVVYTIFRREGKSFGELELSYDRFNEVDDLDGMLYDEHGKEVRELSSKVIKDESDISAYSLYEDARIKKAELYSDHFPYTVEFRYTILHDGLLGYPSWCAQSSDEPVEQTRFEVILPKAMGLRYWTSTPLLVPAISETEDNRLYLWEAHDLKELSDEELAEDLEVRTAVVRIAPQEFELDGHAGTMRDWREFGLWSASLFSGKGILPPDAARDVDSLTTGVTVPRAKAERLYRYMQGKTRYINVTLGIGGWEPYDATYVHLRGYGDCKALSNYMIALLARAGVRSMPALVYAGGARSSILEGFPENRFNHVIVCVPFERDSLWLECTSQLCPFGYLGDFTENRPALLLTPEGGVMVRTPATLPEMNSVQRFGRVVLTGVGNASADLVVKRTGNFAETVRGVMSYGSPQEREEWLLRDLDVNGTELRSYATTGVLEHASLVSITMDVNLPRLGSSSGSRLFLVPDLTHRNSTPPKEFKARKSPVRYTYGFVTIDSIRFVLPDGFSPEALPAPVQLHASFGAYRARTIALGDTALLHVRSLEIRTPVIPAERYQEYVRFMKDVVKADKAQAVLTRKH